MKRKRKMSLDLIEERPKPQIPKAVCQNCEKYYAKMCGVTGKYTARKNTCRKHKYKESE